MDSKTPLKQAENAAPVTVKGLTDVDVRTGMQVATLKQAVTDHLRYSIGTCWRLRHPMTITARSHWRCVIACSSAG